MTDELDDPTLFHIDTPPPVSLADKFGVPPMSVLDRRAGAWQDRRRRWLSLGIASELGRDTRSGALADLTGPTRSDFIARIMRGEQVGTRTIGALVADGVSVFDPVICELVYRWFSPPGGQVLDPFAGGSVRGVVASVLGRRYRGIDLRPEQVEANRSQTLLGHNGQPRPAPSWVAGDSRTVLRQMRRIGHAYDLIFTCPPYGDLERYSDDPADLSAMSWGDFLHAHRAIIRDAVRLLKPDRFAAWVISDIRGPGGAYRGLVVDTIATFRRHGLELHNDLIILDQVGHAALRAERPFIATRKVTRVHQHLLVFVKGDAHAATAVQADDQTGLELIDAPPLFDPFDSTGAVPA
jgi:hypothetical protein